MAMYQFEESDACLLERALAKAMSKARRRPINIETESALQFLTREILKLYREGERDVSALAVQAVGSLRNFQQVQESVHRVPRPVPTNVAQDR